jgi:hypothetical protein
MTDITEAIQRFDALERELRDSQLEKMLAVAPGGAPPCPHLWDPLDAFDMQFKNNIDPGPDTICCLYSNGNTITFTQTITMT